MPWTEIAALTLAFIAGSIIALYQFRSYLLRARMNGRLQDAGRKNLAQHITAATPRRRR